MVKFKLKNEDQNEMMKTTEKNVFLKTHPIPKLRILGPIIYLIINMTVKNYIICKMIGDLIITMTVKGYIICKIIGGI